MIWWLFWDQMIFVIILRIRAFWSLAFILALDQHQICWKKNEKERCRSIKRDLTLHLETPWLAFTNAYVSPCSLSMMQRLIPIFFFQHIIAIVYCFDLQNSLWFFCDKLEVMSVLNLRKETGSLHDGKHFCVPNWHQSVSTVMAVLVVNFLAHLST